MYLTQLTSNISLQSNFKDLRSLYIMNIPSMIRINGMMGVECLKTLFLEEIRTEKQERFIANRLLIILGSSSLFPSFKNKCWIGSLEHSRKINLLYYLIPTKLVIPY